VVSPSQANPVLREVGSSEIERSVSAIELLRRPGVRAVELARAAGAPFGGSNEGLSAVEVEIKYEGYVRREEERAARLREQAEFVLSKDLPYQEMITLSREARDKLSRTRPENLAQAGRIPGVSPADLQNLLLEVRRWRHRGSVAAL
jgi:tRNA uridine 5-carboxymethylaminomethyl modification enzyme